MSKQGRQVNVHEAKTHLSRLLACVAAGEEVIIARAGHPIARLIPVTTAVKARTPGRDAGKGWIADDFDTPLPEDLQRFFEGGSDA